MAIASRFAVLVLIAAAFGCAACGSRSEEPLGTSFSPRTFDADWGESLDGEFGMLTVPENHKHPEGPRIQLAVARFGSPQGASAPVVIYLAGGPGAAGIHPERMPLFRELRKVVNVVTFDQRGTGASSPVLSCSERAELPDGAFGTLDALLALHRTIAAACARRLRAEGRDLTAYNALQSVEDIEFLRRALGIETYSLVGVSFGSHLALATMRAYPERVDRAVLAGVEGLDQTIKLPSNLDRHLAMVSDYIAADPAAGAVLPDLEGFVRRTVRDLRENGPRAIRRSDGRSVTMTAHQFATRVAGTIVRTEFLRQAPEEFGPMLNGDFSGFDGGVRSARTFGMRALMDCSSGVSADRWQTVLAERETSLLGSTMDTPYPDVCDAWGVPDLGDEFRSGFTFDGPVQFISGSLDGLTPISNVEEIRSSFPNSGHIIVDPVGHEGPLFWFGADEMMDLVRAFLTGSPPVDRTLEADPIEWVLP